MCVSADKFSAAATDSTSNWGDDLAALLEAEFPPFQGNKSKGQRLKDVWSIMFPGASNKVNSEFLCLLL